jgi:hypothetical protein
MTQTMYAHVNKKKKKRGMWAHSKTAVTYNQEKNETYFAGTLILNFQPPEMWENKFVFFTIVINSFLKFLSLNSGPDTC